MTGPGAASATGLTVDADGTVQLTGTDVVVAPGDVTVKSLSAGSANLSATNTLSLVESQITTAKDLTLSAKGTVRIQDGEEAPVAVNAGGNLSITGNQGIDIATINVDVPALQSGGNLKLSSDGLITADAALSSGGNLSFEDLVGGSGNLLNHDRTNLSSKGVVNLGNYTGVSLKVEANGSIRGGDFTITGRKKTGVDQNDPDYETLTFHPALILRAGKTDPASIISIGNVTAHGGIVELSTNGNIFTGNIDVSPYTPIPIYGYAQQRIALKGYNIFTGNLNAGSDIAPGTYTLPYDPLCVLSDLDDVGSGGCLFAPSPQSIAVPSGSISLDATQYLRTGNIGASSRTDRGGNVTIQAGDAIVGTINTSGSGSYYAFGGDVSVKTDVPFKSGAITTDGVQKGVVAIEQREVSPDISNGIDFDSSDISPEEIIDVEQVRENTLQFMSARLLAGKKMTAHEIATELEIPLEIAQIAILNPIGDNIEVPIPDLSELNDDILFAGGRPGLGSAVLKILQQLFPKAFPKATSGSKPLEKWILKAPTIPGRVKTRINIRNGEKNVVGSGLNNALKKHGGTGPSSKSQFSISTEEIKEILQRKDVIQSPVRTSGTSGNYIREVDIGKTIGNLPLNKGGQPTRVITIITDKFGNLVNTFPGTLGRGGALK